MENEVVKRCTHLISVTEDMSEDFRKRYPGLGFKMKTYSNGFDESELIGHEIYEKPKLKELSFFHAGSLDYGRTPYPFLRAIKELVQERKIGADDIRVMFWGDCKVKGTHISGMIREFGLEHIVHCDEHRPHAVCLKEMSRFDVLLLFNIDQPLQVPAKLYEYLLARRNILSISTGGITDRIIKQTRAGVSYAPENIDGIKRAIQEYLDDRRFRGDEGEIAKYNSHLIFNDLMQELDRLSNALSE